MRIVFCIETPLRYGGGVSAVTASLMEGLGNEARFILVSREPTGGLAKDPLASRIESHLPWWGKKSPPHPEYFRSSQPLLAEIAELQPDLVHFHAGQVYAWGNRWPGTSWPAYLSQRGIPCVWTDHSVVSLFHGYCGEQKPFWFRLAMLPVSYLGKSQQLAATSAEICVSDHDAGKIRRWYFPFSKKVKRIYHSRLAEREIAFSPLPREKMILAVGHLAFRKGQHILVQAFARLAPAFSDWKLILVGPGVEGDCGQWIARFSRQNRLTNRIQMLGSQNEPDFWMRRCGVFVQPSLQEALGLALQEAMACGCACIGTSVGGIPELLGTHKAGVLVPSGEIGSLQVAMENLLLDSALRTRLGKMAVQRIQVLTMNRLSMVNQHRKAYREILQGVQK
jgi:glycosyltransferase involved in cell wall biosynthesis